MSSSTRSHNPNPIMTKFVKPEDVTALTWNHYLRQTTFVRANICIAFHISEASAPHIISVSSNELRERKFAIIRPIGDRVLIGQSGIVPIHIPMEEPPRYGVGDGGSGNPLAGNEGEPDLPSFARDEYGRIVHHHVSTAPLTTRRRVVVNYGTQCHWHTVAERDIVVNPTLYKKCVAGQKELKLKLPAWRYEFVPAYFCSHRNRVIGRGDMDFQFLVDWVPDKPWMENWPIKLMDRRVLVYGYSFRDTHDEYLQHEVLDKGGQYINAHKSNGLLDRCRHGKFISVSKKKYGCTMCRFEASPLHARLVEKRDEKAEREANICSMILGNLK